MISCHELHLLVEFFAAPTPASLGLQSDIHADVQPKTLPETQKNVTQIDTNLNQKVVSVSNMLFLSTCWGFMIQIDLYTHFFKFVTKKHQAVEL